MSTPLPTLDAISIVPHHDGAIHLARRHEHHELFAGYHGFLRQPLVDNEETCACLDHYPDVEARFLHGLVSAARQHLGLDLLAGLCGGGASLMRLGAHVTSAPFPQRYNTRFFRVDLPQREPLRLDSTLYSHGEWATPAEWRRRYEHGEILLSASDRHVIEGLSSNSGPIPGLHPIPLTDAILMSEAVHGVRQFWVRSNTLPPALHTNCYLIGDAGGPRMLVDPSPNSSVELERLCLQAGRIGFDAVMLTHHHPDHRQFADEVARRFRVPLAMSADTRQRLMAIQPRFFEGLDVRVLAEGDEVARWRGLPVRVLEVPGHDEGHLALMPDNRAWCIVGDLIQGVGTVVISAPEGNMAKYFASLKRIIALRPGAIFPSHGLGLGGVHVLEKTLMHRERREDQVRALMNAGHGVEHMLALMYAGMDARLLPLARANILSHLQKLRDEALQALP